MPQVEGKIKKHLSEKKPIWLFLDYDGTLADFAPTPDVILPNPQVIDLLTRLEKQPLLRISVISGRRLEHIEKLLPVPGLLLAGTYGIELYLPEGKRRQRIQLESVRPVLEEIKPKWKKLIDGREGFYLEDKGWAIALHAKYADEASAGPVLTAAREVAQLEAPDNEFRILGGHRFLEIGSLLADKGTAVRYLVENFPLAEALYIFMGDDDKDEEAFKVIKELGGLAVVVAKTARPSVADLRLETPKDALAWLEKQFS